MQRFSLTSAELAVLVDHMTGGRLLEQTTTLPELHVDEQALEAAEEGLLDRGLLVSLPFEEASGVTSELADPAEPSAAAASLSWLETDAGLWLVDGASDGEAPLAAPVTEKALRQRVAAAVEGPLSGSLSSPSRP